MTFIDGDLLENDDVRKHQYSFIESPIYKRKPNKVKSIRFARSQGNLTDGVEKGTEKNSWYENNKKAIELFARDDFKASLALHKENLKNLGNKRLFLLAETYRNIGVCYLSLGNLYGAMDPFTEYLTIAKKLNNQYLISCACYFMFYLYDLILEEYVDNRAIVKTALANIEEYKMQREKANSQITTITKNNRKPFEEALKIFERALNDNLGDQQKLIGNHLNIAGLCILLKDFDKALNHCNKAEILAEGDEYILQNVAYGKYQCYSEMKKWLSALKSLLEYKKLCANFPPSCHVANIKLIDLAYKLHNKDLLKKFANEYYESSIKLKDVIGLARANEILLKCEKDLIVFPENSSEVTKTPINRQKKTKRDNIINWNRNNDEAIKNFANLNVRNSQNLHLLNILIASSDRNMKNERMISTLNAAICCHRNKEYPQAIEYFEKLITKKHDKNKAFQWVASFFIINSYERLLFEERAKNKNICTIIARHYKNSIKTYKAKMLKLAPSEKKLAKIFARNINIHKNALKKLESTHKQHNLLILGEMYFATKQYELAIEKFKEALRLAKAAKNIKLQSDILLMIYKCSHAQKNNENVIKYLMNYFNFVKNGTNYIAKCIAYESLIKYYRIRGEKDSMEKYITEYKASVNCNRGTMSWEYIRQYLPENIRKEKFHAKSLEDLTNIKNQVGGNKRSPKGYPPRKRGLNKKFSKSADFLNK